MIDRLAGIAAATALLLLLGACASNNAVAPSPAFERLQAFERLGLEAVQQDRWDRAVEYFGFASVWARSLDQRAAEARAELNLAWVEERSARADLARTRLQRLLDGPFMPEARAEAALRLARLAVDGGGRTEARRLAAVARALIPPAAPRLLAVDSLQARLDLLDGHTGRAVVALQELIKRASDEQEKAGALRLLAEAQLAQDAPAVALESLEAAFRLDAAAGRSSRLAQNLALQAQALTRLQQVERAAVAAQRSAAVCQAWLQRFPASSRWRPLNCGERASSRS